MFAKYCFLLAAS